MEWYKQLFDKSMQDSEGRMLNFAECSYDQTNDSNKKDYDN